MTAASRAAFAFCRTPPRHPRLRKGKIQDMPRSALISDPQPYTYFGTFAGLPFWPGGLTLLAAAPGVGKTSWMLRMVAEAAALGFPAALGCYEHTAEELKYRLRMQAEAATAGAHGPADIEAVEKYLAASSETVLLPLSDAEDTLRAIEETLTQDYGFPGRGPALLAVDYLQRVPVVGLTGLLSEEQRGGEAAAMLRGLARRRGWAVIAAAAIRGSAFNANIDEFDLSALVGDERAGYEPDRVLLLSRTVRPCTAPTRQDRFADAANNGGTPVRDGNGASHPCGCVDLDIHTLKDRTGPLRRWQMMFWGERFYPALESEGVALPEGHRDGVSSPFVPRTTAARRCETASKGSGHP